MGIGKDYVALVVLGDVLLNGDASRLYQGLVKGKELMLQVQGGVNFPFESPWRNAGPTLLELLRPLQAGHRREGGGGRGPGRDREDRDRGHSRPPSSPG